MQLSSKWNIHWAELSQRPQAARTLPSPSHKLHLIRAPDIGHRFVSTISRVGLTHNAPGLTASLEIPHRTWPNRARILTSRSFPLLYITKLLLNHETMPFNGGSGGFTGVWVPSLASAMPPRWTWELPLRSNLKSTSNEIRKRNQGEATNPNTLRRHADDSGERPWSTTSENAAPTHTQRCEVRRPNTANPCTTKTLCQL